jgi:adhesin/invasin
MALADPIFPQTVDGIIPIQSVTNDGAVIVLIPAYTNAAPLDQITVLWNFIGRGQYTVADYNPSFPIVIRIPAVFAPIGRYLVSYIIEDRFGNTTSSETVLVEVSNNALLLEAEVSTANIVAGSGIPHIIDYWLITPAGAGVPDRLLQYSVDGSATLVPPVSDTTDGNGHTQLRIFSGVPGTVTVHTVLASDPSTVYSHIRLTFFSTVLTQLISAEVKADKAQGNGLGVNRIRYQVRTLAGNLPVANAEINFSAIGGAALSPSAEFTDSNGYITLTLTNNTSGIVTITALLPSGLGTENFTRVTFT